MASIASSSSSTPRPARGQLWISKISKIYSVVISTGDGRVTEMSRYGDTSPLLSDFLGDNEYVGEFAGSKWRDRVGRWGDRGSIVTVRLNQNNTVRIVTSLDMPMQPYNLAAFLEITTFVSAGPASAGSAASTPLPARGELWRRRRDGLYAVVIGINGPNVISISSFGEGGFWGVDQFIGLFTKVGEFDGSTWEDENGQWRGILTVSLTPSNTVRIVSSRGEIIMQSYSVREFLDNVTFKSAGPALAGAGGPASIAQPNLQGNLQSNFSETHTGWRVRFSFRDTPLEARSALKSYLDGWMGDWKWHSRSESIQTDGMEGGKLYDGRRLDPATFTNRMMAPPNSTRVRVLTNGPDDQDPSTYFRWFLFWIPKRWSYPTRFIDIFINMLSRRFSEFPPSDISLRYDNTNRLVSASLGRDSSLVAGSSTESAIISSGDDSDGGFNELFGSDSDDSDGGFNELVGNELFGSESDEPAGTGGSTSEPPRRNRKRKRKTASERKRTAKATGLSEFHETGEQPAGAFEVLLGDEFKRVEFLDLGNFYLERKLVLRNFLVISADCDYGQGDKLYPIIVNKSSKGGKGADPWQDNAQVYCLTEILNLLKQNRQARCPYTQRKIETIHIMTEAEVQAWEKKIISDMKEYQVGEWKDRLNESEQLLDEDLELKVAKLNEDLEREKAKLNEDLKREKVKLAREKKMLERKEEELLEAREKLKRKRSVGDGSGAGSSSMRLQDLKL